MHIIKQSLTILYKCQISRYLDTVKIQKPKANRNSSDDVITQHVLCKICYLSNL